jgi:hypothetical protein
VVLALVVVEVRAPASRVVHRVVAAAADEAHLDPARARALRHEAVVAAARVDAHVAGLALQEPPPERRPPAVCGHADLDAVAALRAVHLHHFRRIGEVDLGFLGQEVVEGRRRLHQVVAARLHDLVQVAAVELQVLGRQPPHRRGDHVVRDRALELARRLQEGRALEAGEEPPVHLAGVPGQTEDAGVVALEADQHRMAGAREREQEPVVVGERHVAVGGEGQPRLLLALAHPFPLCLVAVPVADEEVEEPGFEVRACVDALPRIGVEDLDEVLGLDDLLRAFEQSRQGGIGVGVLLDDPELALELLAELAQLRVVRQHVDGVGHVENARRVRQAVHHDRGHRIRRADLILHDPVRGRVAQLLGQRGARVLVHGPETEVAAVGRLEAERDRLLAAALFGGREPAGEVGEVQHRHPYRGCPRPAVVGAEEEPMQRPGLVPRAGHDDLRGRGGVRPVWRGLRVRPARCGHETYERRGKGCNGFHGSSHPI